MIVYPLDEPFVGRMVLDLSGFYWSPIASAIAVTVDSATAKAVLLLLKTTYDSFCISVFKYAKKSVFKSLCINPCSTVAIKKPNFEPQS